MDLALNNLQLLIRHKTQPNKQYILKISREKLCWKNIKLLNLQTIIRINYKSINSQFIAF